MSCNADLEAASLSSASILSEVKMPGDEIVLYESPEGEIQLEVHLEQETVWLSLTQIAALFGRDKSVISRHLRNVFTSKELEREAVVAFFATTAADGKTYQVEHFNLDAIVSVGYRVNSRRGTQFRIWATHILRQHLLQGFTLDKRRLHDQGLDELHQAVDLLAHTLTQRALITDEGQAVLDVVQRYMRTWRLLYAYDEGQLPEAPTSPQAPTVSLMVPAARELISQLRAVLIARGEATTLFGLERSGQFDAALGAIEQTFAGEPLYPSAQVRAAHLLYFLIKDHPFIDGNKRIGTLLFLEYLRLNLMLMRSDGSARFADNALVALALLVAESRPAHKDIMIRLIVTLLDENLS